MNKTTYYTDIYYSKDITGNVRSWSGKVIDEYDTVKTIITTGLVDGKQSEIIHNTDIGKNIGKANSTTAYKQAVKELVAKTKIKSKHGYKRLSELGDDIATLELSGNRLYEVLDTRLSINKTDANNRRNPMKAIQFKKVKKFNFPYIVQPKINGFRSTMVLNLDNDTNDLFSNSNKRIKLLSKEGLEYVLPNITNISPIIFKDDVIFDGELYVHNEILSNIKRRIPIVKNNKASNNSLDSTPVRFYCFDLSIPDVSQKDRINIKNNLLHGVTSLNYLEHYHKFILSSNTPSYIINVNSVIANNLDDVYKYLDAALKSGFEGIVLRDFDAEYMFGGRKTNMIKLKKLLSGEFTILDVIKKNEDNRRIYITFVLRNDINDLTFECTPEGDESMRQELLANKHRYIGKLVTASYYERTVTGKPFHAVGRIRESFDMDLNDLQIEL